MRHTPRTAGAFLAGMLAMALCAACAFLNPTGGADFCIPVDKLDKAATIFKNEIRFADFNNDGCIDRNELLFELPRIYAIYSTQFAGQSSSPTPAARSSGGD